MQTVLQFSVAFVFDNRVTYRHAQWSNLQHLHSSKSKPAVRGKSRALAASTGRTRTSRSSVFITASMQAARVYNKDLVLLGGGHSHLSVLLMFGMRPVPGVRLTLISRDIHTPYSGMLPGYVAGHYMYDDCHIDLAILAQWAGARFIYAEAESIDLQGQRVLLKGRPAVRYDVLSINLGITPDINALPGAAEFATPVKPIFSFVERFQQLLKRSQALQKAPRIAVIGGGAGGVEIALALAYRLEEERVKAGLPEERKAQISLITRGALLTAHSAYAAKVIRPLLQKRGIKLYEGAGAQSLEKGKVLLADGNTVDVDEVLLCTQAAAPSWLRQTGLPLDKQGFISIGDTLQLHDSPPNVFACGDVATSVNHPRPKAGVFAVRQGAPLAENIRALLTGKPLQAFVPQTTFLSLISTGDKCAVGTKGGWLGIQGGWVWSWKDHIDRSFMYKFGRDLPPQMDMQQYQQPVASDNAEYQQLQQQSVMRCNGCGSKVGATLLKRVLKQLPSSTAQGVVVGLNAPDDAAVLKPPPAGHVLLQSVDFMRAFVTDPYVFGAIVANHCMADIYAMGGQPTSALAVVGVPFGGSQQVEADLSALLHGATSILDAAGCALVGGHTSELSELALGLSITGSVQEGKVLQKSGLKLGQALVLTKAVGTGTLLAAAMHRKTKGRYIQGALDSMLLPNAAAMQLLREHGVTACTDVTGFGLLGHAAELAEASQVTVQIHAAKVPLLEGAAEASQEGVRSSLHEDNNRVAESVLADKSAVQHQRWPLLVDPQTSGGMLAGVPASSADKLVAALHEVGYPHAAVIGEVVQGPAALDVQ